MSTANITHTGSAVSGGSSSLAAGKVPPIPNTQANKMMHNQGKDVENREGGAGAVVTVKPDYRAVSHNIGIVGVTNEM
jgi:hypothetical protein